MKKQLLLILMTLLPMVAWADEVEINGIYYNLNTDTKEAEVARSPNSYTGNVVIPKKVTYYEVDYNVTSIGRDAFYYCNDLTSVNISNGVTLVGSCAFSDCSSLTSIIIPNSVMSIGEFAFFDCI